MLFPKKRYPQKLKVNSSNGSKMKIPNHINDDVSGHSVNNMNIEQSPDEGKITE